MTVKTVIQIDFSGLSSHRINHLKARWHYVCNAMHVWESIPCCLAIKHICSDIKTSVREELFFFVRFWWCNFEVNVTEETMLRPYQCSLKRELQRLRLDCGHFTESEDEISDRVDQGIVALVNCSSENDYKARNNQCVKAAASFLIFCHLLSYRVRVNQLWIC